MDECQSFEARQLMRSRTPERMHSMSSCFSELNCLNSKKGEQPKRVEIEDAGEDAFEFMFQGEQEHKLECTRPLSSNSSRHL